MNVIALLAEVDAVAWAKIHFQFRYPFTDGLHISEVAVFDSINPGAHRGCAILNIQ